MLGIHYKPVLQSVDTDGCIIQLLHQEASLKMSLSEKFIDASLEKEKDKQNTQDE